MRIEEIRLSWFRGAAEESVLRTDGMSLVIYGPNASRKSCFTDSLEYVLGGGRIDHLRHEYSGYYQQDAVRNTHAAEDQVVQIEILFEGDRKLHAAIQPQGTHTLTAVPDDLLAALAGWRPHETILRQDGLVKFIDQDKSDRYSALLPLFGLTSLEAAAGNMHRLCQEIRSRSTLASDRQRARQLTENAEKAFGSAREPLVVGRLGELWSRYSQDEKPPDLVLMVSRLMQELDERIDRVNPDQRLHVHLEGVNREELNIKVAEAVATGQRANALVDDLLDKKLPILQKAEEFLAAIDPQQTEVGCPACGLDVRVDAFREHVQGELGRLGEARAARDAAEAARTSFVSALRTAQPLLHDELVSSWVSTTGAKEAFEIIRDIDLQALSGGTDSEPLKNLQPQVDLAQACIADAVKVAPPDVRQLLADRATMTCAQELLQLSDLEEACERVENLLGGLESVEEALRQTIQQRTQKVIEDISDDVQGLWSMLHPSVPITGIRLCIPPGGDKAIEIALSFYGKDQASPRNVLSEGYRNSLGLCIFLALLLRDERESWPIVLDDVVSSYDREHRGFLVDILLERFPERQVIVLTHDREWFAELKGRLQQNRWKFVRIGIWSGPESGIRVIDARHTFEEALDLVETNPAAAASMARGIMDRRLAMISERLKLPMTFVRGDANDHRMAVEFLDHLISEMPRRLQVKDGADWVPTVGPPQRLREARERLIYWSNPEAHGLVGAVEECRRLIEICDEALKGLRCSDCGYPVWERNDGDHKRLYCRGDHLRWKYGGPSEN